LIGAILFALNLALIGAIEASVGRMEIILLEWIWNWEGRKEEGRKEVNKELNSNDWNKPGEKLRMQQIEVF
jgi:hypothetical protein